ncbi:MAG: hypothetical protein HY814_14280 [Candidatus Riflebacteria bacterium]|nr:hypothetical protein [Candidatus Riflebacteria bacterium]
MIWDIGLLLALVVTGVCVAALVMRLVRLEARMKRMEDAVGVSAGQPIPLESTSEAPRPMPPKEPKARPPQAPRTVSPDLLRRGMERRFAERAAAKRTLAATPDEAAAR